MLTEWKKSERDTQKKKLSRKRESLCSVPTWISIPKIDLGAFKHFIDKQPMNMFPCVWRVSVPVSVSLNVFKSSGPLLLRLYIYIHEVQLNSSGQEGLFAASQCSFVLQSILVQRAAFINCPCFRDKGLNPWGRHGTDINTLSDLLFYWFLVEHTFL